MAGRVPRASYPFKGSCNNESGGSGASIYNTLQQNSLSQELLKIIKTAPCGREKSNQQPLRYMRNTH